MHKKTGMFHFSSFPRSFSLSFSPSPLFSFFPLLPLSPSIFSPLPPLGRQLFPSPASTRRALAYLASSFYGQPRGSSRPNKKDPSSIVANGRSPPRWFLSNQNASLRTSMCLPIKSPYSFFISAPLPSLPDQNTPSLAGFQPITLRLFGSLFLSGPRADMETLLALTWAYTLPDTVGGL